MRNEKPEMNEQTGNTIRFQSPEQLTAEGPKAIAAPVVPDVVGKSFAEIAHASTIEHRPTYVEQIPETVSLDRLKSDCLDRLDGQYGGN
jgi:hypothetical protein